MSLTSDLASLQTDLAAEATTPASYSRDAVAVPVNILLGWQEQKSIGANDAEVLTYEQHVMVLPVELAGFADPEPQPGDTLTFTDASGRSVILEVNRNRDGNCFRMTKSGRWFRTFVKRLAS